MTELNFSSPDFGNLWTVLEDPKAADFVASPTSNRYLEPFIRGECSVAQVARELGVDPGSVLYRVKQMLELGLIEKTRLEPRSGRAIQFYRSSTVDFFAPLRLTGAASFEEMRRGGGQDAQAQLEKSLFSAWQALNAEAEWGVHLYRTLEGEINRDFVPLERRGETSFWDTLKSSEAPPLWDQFLNLKLSRANAKALQLELASVIQRFGPLHDEDEPLYLVRLALTPLGPDAVRSGR